MTVNMTLPHTKTAFLHAGRRVAAFFSITSTDMLVIAALTTRAANRNGIIRLTFTA